MVTQELGEVFRSARQQAGLSLDDIYEQTKISVYVLKALENGDNATLPHPVYTRGFVRSYAKLLRIDQDDVVMEYLAVVEPGEPLTLEADVSELHMSRKSKVRTWWLVGLTTLVLLAAAWLIVSYVVHEITPSSVVVDQEETQEVPLLPSDTRVEEGTSADQPMTGQAAQEPVEPSKGTSADGTSSDGISSDGTSSQETPADKGASSNGMSTDPTGASRPAAGQGDAGRTDGVTKPYGQHELEEGSQVAEEEQGTQTLVVEEQSRPASAVSGGEGAPLAAQTPRAHTLCVEATHPCWMRAIADTQTYKKKTIRLLEPGQTVNLAFDEDVELRLGNGGGVLLFVDGEPFAFEGKLGDVKTVKVSASEE